MIQVAHSATRTNQAFWNDTRTSLRLSGIDTARFTGTVIRVSVQQPVLIIGRRACGSGCGLIWPLTRCMNA